MAPGLLPDSDNAPPPCQQLLLAARIMRLHLGNQATGPGFPSQIDPFAGTRWGATLFNVTRAEPRFTSGQTVSPGGSL